MAGTKMTREQFEIFTGPHSPYSTGARFDFYPGRPEEFSTLNWGLAGAFSKKAATSAR
jgi:hypothetical protein